jgi:hypothetical protein
MPELQTFYLEPRIEELQAIVVQEKIEVFDNSGMNASRIKFSPSQMSNIPSLTQLDILAPLQMLPGYQKNSTRLPEYFRIDSGLNYAIHLGKTELKIGSNFFNILNNKNVINRFDQLSPTPFLDVNQGINPVEVNTV